MLQLPSVHQCTSITRLERIDIIKLFAIIILIKLQLVTLKLLQLLVRTVRGNAERGAKLCGRTVQSSTVFNLLYRKCFECCRWHRQLCVEYGSVLAHEHGDRQLVVCRS